MDRQAWSQTTAITTFTPDAGEIYVAISAGIEEARSFVHIDVSDLDEATIAGSTLVLHEGGDALMPAGAVVVVCALGAQFTGNGQLSGAPPPVDCGLRTNATRDLDGAWTVELGIFAQRWAAGDNNGLVLFPDASQTGATYRVGLDTARSDVQVHGGTSTETQPSATPSAASATSGAEGSPSPPTPPVLVSGDAAPPTSPDSTTASLGSSAEPAVLPAPAGESTVGVQRPTGRSTAGSAALAMLLVLAASAFIVLATPLRRRVALPAGSSPVLRHAAEFMPFVLVTALVLAPLLLREAIIYKAGVVLIFFVAAIGLHVLVNWAGQLSLAHAGMVGLPAFSVLTLSELHQISPIYLLPVAAVIGAVVGAVVALPTLRARGLQVTIVTLLAGIAINRFFFTKTWLVGSGAGRAAATPTLGPFEFTTSRSLYPVLLGCVLVAVLAAWILMHSKVARGWYWVRVNEDAASTFGIPVVTYRIFAYTIGGAFAGLAGGLAVMWVQRLSPQTFPTTLSFTYLLIAVLAGAGFVGGLAASTMLLQGGQQFATNIFGPNAGNVVDFLLVYGGPVGLINVLTRYQAGFNGIGRKFMQRIRVREHASASSLEQEEPAWTISPALIAGTVAIVAGFVAIGLAWRHSSQTDQLWVQNQEVLSGGFGGLGLLLVGSALLIRDRLGQNQTALADRLEALFGKADLAERTATIDSSTEPTASEPESAPGPALARESEQMSDNERRRRRVRVRD